MISLSVDSFQDSRAYQLARSELPLFGDTP
jgi:hypothetical protein